MKVQLTLLGLAGLLVAPAMGADLHFETLRAGAQVFSNVTVQSKSDRYLFIRHDRGLSTIKVQDLSPKVRAELGYSVEPTRPRKRSVFAAVKKLPIHPSPVQARQAQQFERAMATNFTHQGHVNWTLLGALFFFSFAFHLFFSYAAHQICVKTGHEPGLLIWIPGLQVIPLLQAAGMSGWWFLLLFVPFLNLIVSIMWPFKICQARGKSMLWAVMLLLPGLNLIAFLYLAFSNGGHEEPDSMEQWRYAQTARIT